MGGDRLREVVAHGGSTVYQIKGKTYQSILKNVHRWAYCNWITGCVPFFLSSEFLKSGDFGQF